MRIAASRMALSAPLHARFPVAIMGARRVPLSRSLSECTTGRVRHLPSLSIPQSHQILGAARQSSYRGRLGRGSVGLIATVLVWAWQDTASCDGDDKPNAPNAHATAMAAVNAMLQHAAASGGDSSSEQGPSASAALSAAAAALLNGGRVSTRRGGEGDGGDAPPSSFPGAGAGAGGEPHPDMNLEELGVQLSFGTVAGFCSGYALKKASKVVAFTIGAGFVTVQVMRYNGLISDIHWEGYEKRFTELLDADGDGRVTVADLQIHLRKLVDVLGFNVPSTAAFGTAFFLGLRYG